MIHKADKELKEKWLHLFSGLPDGARNSLIAALLALRSDAAGRAAYSWAKHKAPMALYWKVVSVYAGHLARAVAKAAP